MKRKLMHVTLLLGCVMLWASCCQNSSIGLSMSRWEDLSVDSMKEAREAGVEYIEVTLLDLIGSDTTGLCERANQLKQDIDSAGLEVWSVHLPYSRKWDISLIDSTKRAGVVDFMKKMVRVAGIFHPRYLILHPSHEPVAPDERFERLTNSRASIGQIAPVVQEIGAELCIENLPRTCLGKNGEEMMFLIEGYEGVGLCFDTNHLLYQSHEDFLNTIDKAAIKTVHLSDYGFAHECHFLPGTGDIEWKPLWDGIRANGYRGIMMFECEATPQEVVQASELLTGKRIQEISTVDADSLAFSKATWQVTELEKGAQVLYAQIPMFYSMQSVSVVKYPSSEFKTEILHRPGKKAGKPSEIGKKEKALCAINAGFFHVKPRTPSVYFRIGDKVYGQTHPTETYRVDGVVGFKDKAGREMVIAYSDTTQYQSVSSDWHTVMASGPMLVYDGELVVPFLMGDMADGANIAAMQQEQKTGAKIRTHYSSVQFYDARHPRAAVGKDDEGNIYYVVIDGRFKGQGDGASIYETAYICKMLGMTEAINLDGGGSSTLWNKKTGVVNHPYDNKKWDHEGERAVPNLIIAQ